jgi:hypothetical protein
MLPNKTKNWKKHFNRVNCGRQHLIPATCCDFSLWPEHINHDKCHFEHTLQYAKLWRKWSNAHILKEACIELESMTSPNTVEVIINSQLWRNRNLATRATMKQRQAKQNNPSLPFSWSEHNKKKIDGSSHCIRLWYHSWNTNWWNFKHL